MRLRWPISETNATARNASTSAISQAWPAAKPARSSASFEMKRPNGGRPIRASIPAANSHPVTGMVRSRPETWRRSPVP